MVSNWKGRHLGGSKNSSPASVEATGSAAGVAKVITTAVATPINPATSAGNVTESADKDEVEEEDDDESYEDEAQSSDEPDGAGDGDGAAADAEQPADGTGSTAQDPSMAD